MKKLILVGLICLFSSWVYGQDARKDENAEEKTPSTSTEEKSKIKTVPTAGKKSKPVKISSSARSRSLQPAVAPPTKKTPPAKGKPASAGKSKGN